MRTWAKASAPAALLAVAVMSLGSGTALADTSGDSSIGGGNQINAPVSLPIDISGNAVGVVGKSHADSEGGASVENKGAGTGGNTTSGRHSVLGGNQVNAPISAPINACGNALSLIGSSDAGCKGGASVKNKGVGGGGNRTSGDSSVLGGNQVNAPISTPVNVCGNALAIFGSSTAGCKGGASVKNKGVGVGGNRTSGRHSVLGGNQVVAPISAPINICGNSAAVLGRAFSGCKGGSSVTNGGHTPYRSPRGSTGNDTDGRFAVGSGNQVIAPVSLPITACGNAVGNAHAGCKGGASVKNNGGSGAGGNTTSGRGSVLGGNQVIAPITAPINVCGNSVAVIGRAFSGCKGGASVKNGGSGAGGNRTSGDSSVLGGNQVVAPITAPVNVCGNAVAVIGLAQAHCKGGASVSLQGGTGAGGNRTSGRHSVLGGNQVIAPITAPINVCGNAVAVLGDAAAGCLGGSRVGKPVDDYTPNSHYSYRSKVTSSKSDGVLPALPPVPVLGGLQSVGKVTPMRGGGSPELPLVDDMPLVGDLREAFGLPALPELPGLAGQPSTPVRHVTPAKHVKHVKNGKAPVANAARAADPQSPLAPAASLIASTPVGGVVKTATGSLPTGGLGLMSASQPAGVTGMTTGSLFALVLGAMFAASATLFAATRRFRLGRK
ncbi:chaplin family protein [Nonomuraea guangzhouensis]|uniref:Chaplin family protein n=1 Tax=Nonomuraea guangzhouensis TaxID=1291555 RepID=A0ABW4G8D6_9ACTN|nr:chaplin family protein [Nonomuraea guangzhouensis]